MTSAHIVIKDARNEQGEETIEVEGRLDPIEALDLPPTPAVIIGSYLASNMEQVSKAAIVWFRAMTTAPEQAEEPAIQAPKLILPDDGIQGAPV